jgi:hypothetical protein
MSKQKKFLTEVEVQQIANKFLLDIYFDSKINFGGYQMATTNGIQAYQLFGELTMRSRNLFSRFTVPKSANKFKFTIEIDAKQGKIINYEVI